MSVTPSPIGGFAAQFFDNNGVILSGGKIYTYAAGTTTPQVSYTSASGATPHANPIILDSAGRIPGGEIWLTDGLVYKFVIETATSILIGTYDNITGVNSNFVNYTIQEEVITATAGQTVFNLSTINYTPGTNSLSVYIDGVNQYVGASYLETDSDTVTFTSGVHVGGEVKFTTAVQNTGGAVDAAIVAYDPPFANSVATNVEAKLAQYVSVKDFGAIGDGVADDTAAIQAAIDTGKDIFFPEAKYRTTATLNITTGQRIYGTGTSPYEVALGAIGSGSWLYFDHTDKGISIGGLNLISGVGLDNIGTYRNQPTPAPGWTPNAHDYDVYIDNADVLINDVTLLNPTKGIYLTNGNAGRLTIDNLRGQAFDNMIRIHVSYDVVRISNLHVWPFWQDNADVHAYTIQNLDAIFLERCDNPMLVNIFTIFAKAGIRFEENAFGRTAKCKVINADFDRGFYGIFVGNSMTIDGVTGQFTNVSCQSETGVAGTTGILVSGILNRLSFVNFSSTYSGVNGVTVIGGNNELSFSGGVRVTEYNKDVGGHAAFYVGATSKININGAPLIFTTSTAPRYDGPGAIYVDEWRVYTPTVTALTGTITSATADGRYKLINDTCYITLNIDIIANGTGADALVATLPFTSNGANLITPLYGRCTAVSGKMAQGFVGQAGNTAVINNYDNTYPASNGELILLSGFYPV